MVSRPLRLAVCLGTGYVAAAVVASLAQPGAADGIVWSLGFTVLTGGLVLADALLPGPRIWIGRRASRARQVVFVAGFVLNVSVVVALRPTLEPGWAGPMLLFWTAPMHLVLMLALAQARPSAGQME
jgi:hypothetical protein